MKIILINMDPMVAKLIEATAKKIGITLTGYANTDELDVSALTKDHFVFVDEGALGTDKDRIKSITQDCLSCLLYAKTKALKEFSHIVKKPFLPTDILDILQAELLKVGQDLHNASEVTKEEITQVDGDLKIPDIDMSALDKLGDFDITQEFDAESPLPPLADNISSDIADTPNVKTSELEQVLQSADQSSDSLDSSELEQGGLEDLDSAINFLEESDMDDLDAIGAKKSSAPIAEDSVESSDIADSLVVADSSLDELGEQGLDGLDFSEQVQESQTKESLESSDIDIALDTSLEESAQDLAGDLAQGELLENIPKEIDSSDPQVQTDDITELDVVEEAPSTVDLDELESSAQDESSEVELEEVLGQAQDEASDDQATEQVLDGSEMSALGESAQNAQDGGSAAMELLEEQAECEVLSQDELTLVKNLLEETTSADAAEPLESSTLESSNESSESTDSVYDEGDLESNAQEFADIELDDLAQVETDSSAQEAKESANEDYLQLSESEICQALGEDLPDVESTQSAETADIEMEEEDIESSELETLDPQDQASKLVESAQEQEGEKEQEFEVLAEVAEDETMEIEESETEEAQAQEAIGLAQGAQEQEIEARQASSDEELESKDGAQVDSVSQENLGESGKDLAQDLGNLEESVTKDVEEDLGIGLESSMLDQESQAQERILDELTSKDTLDSMVAHDLQELESESASDQGAPQDLGEFGTSLQAINALRDEMQSLGGLDLFASDCGDTLGGLAQPDDRPSITQANQTQAQLFSELLANKSAQEIRSLLNGAQISINISFSDKI